MSWQMKLVVGSYFCVFFLAHLEAQCPNGFSSYCTDPYKCYKRYPYNVSRSVAIEACTNMSIVGTAPTFASTAEQTSYNNWINSVNINYTTVCQLRLTITLCPNGWIADGSNPTICYAWGQSSFSAATSTCLSVYNSTLPTFNCPNEYNLFLKTNVLVSGRDYWLGYVRSSSNASIFTEFSGKNPAITIPWASNQPDNGNSSKNCVAINATDLSWKVMNCSATVYFPCQLRLPQSTFCPTGWYYDPAYPYICYFLTNASTCSGVATFPKPTLPILLNYNEFFNFYVVSNWLSSSCNESHWMGIVFSANQSLVWYDGSPITINEYTSTVTQQLAQSTGCVGTAGYCYTEQWIGVPCNYSPVSVLCQMRTSPSAATPMYLTNTTSCDSIPTTTTTTTATTSSSTSTSTRTTSTTTSTATPTTTTSTISTTSSTTTSTSTSSSTSSSSTTTSTTRPTTSTSATTMTPAITFNNTMSTSQHYGSALVTSQTSKTFINTSISQLTSTTSTPFLTTKSTVGTTPQRFGSTLTVTSTKTSKTSTSTATTKSNKLSTKQPINVPQSTQQPFTGPTSTTTPKPLPSVLKNTGISPKDLTDPASVAAAVQTVGPMLLASLNDSVKQELGQSLADLVRTCTYDGKDCYNENNFGYLYNPTYGNCYVFNSGQETQQQSFQVLNAGVQHGLKVLLGGSQDDYSCSSQQAGFRLVFNENNLPSYPDSEGYTVAPGTVTYVSLTQKSIVRSNSYWKPCVEKIFESFVNNYTVESCTRLCVQNYTINTCKCMNPFFPEIPNAEYCNLDQKTCMDFASTCSDNVLPTCNCPQPCKQTVYLPTFTKVKFLSKDYRQQHCAHSTNVSKCTSTFDKNFALVYVYYNTLEYKVMSEVEAYGIQNLLSDMAGNSMIFIGGSMFTLAELAAIICAALHRIFVSVF